MHDYHKYINPFIEQSSNSMDIDVLKQEILEYFANITGEALLTLRLSA